MRIFVAVAVFVAGFESLAPAMSAQVPSLINYQGRLVQGTNLMNGTVGLSLRLFNVPAGGTAIYEDSNAVTVVDGLYSTPIGNQTNSGDFAQALTNAEVYVEVGVNGIALLPRERVMSVAYSLITDAVRPGGVTTVMLADGAVTGEKIADGAVAARQLAKPPRSGSILSSSLTLAFGRAAFSVSFSPPFVSAPVVTLGLQGSGAAGHASLYVKSRSASGFAGQWTPDDLPGPQVADSATGAGPYSSLDVVNGRPAVCYYRSPQLLFARADDATGASWGAPVALGFASVGGTSLQVVNGNPAVCFYEVSGGDLMYVRANDPDGATWGTPVAVDTNGNQGGWSSLAVVNGRPAISYYDGDQFDLKFVRAADVNGANWSSPVRVDTNGTVGRYTALAVVNGHPAISYLSDFPFQLSYTRALDADGVSWGAPVYPDPNSGGAATSLAVVDGHPAISHYSASGAQLRYVRAADASGATWSTPVLVDSGLGLDYTSMKVVGGNPAISYAGGEVRYVRALDATGSAWSPSVYLAMDGGGGFYPAPLAMVGAQPALAYYDGQMKFLRQQNASIPAFTINWIALEP